MSKTVLITGTSSGIGRATALLFAHKGWNVVVTQRRPEMETDLTRFGGIALTRLDVLDQASIRSALEFGVARFGQIDVLVNNAAYGQYGLFEAVSQQRIREQFDVNLFGVMDVTRTALPHFRHRGSGVIVNVSSGGGLYALPLMSIYCASKFALEGFSEALAMELLPQGIAVKLIEPYGGVSETKFDSRSAQELSDDKGLSGYESLIDATRRAVAKGGVSSRVSAEDVASVIFDAATDGTDRLRYLVGNDSRGFIRARRELSEADYIAYMRRYFGLERAGA